VYYPIAANKKRLIVFSVAMGFATLSAAGGLRGPVRDRVEWVWDAPPLRKGGSS